MFEFLLGMGPWTFYGILIIGAILTLFTSIPKNLMSKTLRYINAFFYLIMSKDQKKPKDMRLAVNAAKGARIRIVFIRHGESVWNSLFNKFDLGWPLRVVSASLKEFLYFFTDAHDSTIIDSPLSKRGRKQADELAAFVKSDTGRRELCSNVKQSVVVCSNLRRAIETGLLGLQPRFNTTKEAMLVDSSLQEGSRNADATSFSTLPGKLPNTPIYSLSPWDTAKKLDTTNNAGNKTLKSNVFQRMADFTLRVFGEASHKETDRQRYTSPDGSFPIEIIVVGHSLYFRNFFNRFLPASSTHVAKKKKLQNCAVVTFDLVSDANTGEISIDESTIKPLFKNFG